MLVHDVVLAEENDYAPRERVLTGGVELAPGAGVSLRVEGDDVTVGGRRGWVAYPRRGIATRLFTLQPGQVGRYRANFRLTGCACNPSWYYESQLVNVSNGLVDEDAFTRDAPAHDVDDRVHLYGGRRRPAPTVDRRRDPASQPSD
ncbi:hypothetical protein ACQP2X_19365 [Actinoplanes sp. CA-131856]